MIKCEYSHKEKIGNGMVDACCEISMSGELNIVAIELANLIASMTTKYPMVMDLAMKYLEDDKKIRKEINNE